MTSMCSLGYPGNTMTFRLNPDAVDWNFTIEKAIINTLGGRVVQILGTTLSDIVVKGKIGEDHTRSGGDAAAGRSWAMAEAFVKRIHDFEAHQRTAPVPTSKPYDHRTTTPPLRFVFPEFGWDFSCYIKDISDPSGGGAITHSAGKFSYEYALTLFVEAENSASVAVLQGKAEQAADAYISRISQGIGWDRDTARQYSGRTLDQAAVAFPAAS